MIRLFPSGSSTIEIFPINLEAQGLSTFLGSLGPSQVFRTSRLKSSASKLLEVYFIRNLK
jgi:hypothetical protein